MIWRGQGRTHKGRRATNEDALVCRDGEGLWAVIDGMGGHEAGDLAASMVRDSLDSLSLGGGIAHRLVAVETALQTVNHAIRHHAAINMRSKPMGATVVVLLVYRGEAAVMWAGDSRLYRYHDDAMAMLTRDHTPVQDLMDAGQLSEQQAMTHPRANVIYQAVGIGEKLQLDRIRFEPDPLARFLLTSDGIHSVLSVEELGALMRHGVSESGVLKAALDRGSRDNVTALIVGADPEE
ncbi:PP2C family protein-serine/threonine phosphatase [Alcanivorax sediminis]|uniref:Serine/threonine-protein phosphatase n=2 Tax=Alcanivorax sediminis TaxID=2663008 RepID=A0A6N7M3W8_9GAMM|nr:protein phosphatase 2C domain-containing protein [Alcanivorax sediminis]MQX54870.1 serine/threonine-protein phosphatase [Alcanivorax sediminis]